MKANSPNNLRRLFYNVLACLVALALLTGQAAWAAEPPRPTAITAAPIRFEGYIRAQSSTKWVVGNDLEGNRIVNVAADTPIIEKKGLAELGAWVIVRAAVRSSGELDALLIEVDRPAGVTGPQTQLVGQLRKLSVELPARWLVDDTPIEVTESTRITGTPAVDVHVWVGGVILPSGLRAEWVRVLASVTTFEFRGTITEQGADYRIIDGHRVAVTPETTIVGEAVPNAFVECQALQEKSGALVATVIRVLPAAAEARLTGSIQAIHAESADAAIWDVLVDPTDPIGVPRVVQVRVDGNTWIDQSASVAEIGKWVIVRGTAIQAAMGGAAAQSEAYQAGMVRVERGRPAGLLQAMNAGQMTTASAMPWGEPTTIAVSQAYVEHPMLAFTPDHTAHVVWESNGALYYSHQLDGETWTAPQLIAYGFAPHLIADHTGMLHVTFVNLFLGNYETYHIFNRDGRWSLPVNMAYTTGYSAHPKLAVAGDNSLHAVWMDNTPGYWTTYYATWDGQFWSNRPIPSGRGQAPALNVTADGMIYVVWQDRVRRDADSLGDFDIFLSLLRDGTWLPPLDISDSRGVDSLGPDLASTADGEVHIVWVDGEWEVLYSYGRETYWSTPALVAVPADSALYANSPHIAVEGGKYLHLAWAEEDAYGQINGLWATSMPQRGAAWPAGYLLNNTHAAKDATLTTIPGGGVGMSWVEANDAEGARLRISLRQPTRDYRLYIPMLLGNAPLDE